MTVRSFVFACAILGLNPGVSNLHASQVMKLGWDKFRIEAAGVEVWGTQGETGITSLQIKAFKRKFVLTKAQISCLDGFSANGLRIYNVGGYAGLGGETYYLCFYTDSEPEKRISVMVTIEEENGLKIEKGKFQ